MLKATDILLISALPVGLVVEAAIPGWMGDTARELRNSVDDFEYISNQVDLSGWFWGMMGLSFIGATWGRTVIRLFDFIDKRLDDLKEDRRNEQKK